MQRPAPFVITPPAGFLQRNPQLREQAQRLSQAYEERLLIEDQHLQAVGSALWEALELGNKLEQAEVSSGQEALPVIIESADAAILSLPWETLHHPQFGFVGRSPRFTLSRRNPELGTRLPETRPEPLRVLLFTSLPDDLGETARLDVEAEQAAVQEALMQQEQQGEIILEMPDDGRFDSFRTTLHRFKPHLVYLSGHGQFTHEHHNNKAWGSFLFEDPWGSGQSVPEQELVECFKQTGVQLLVMSACLSARQHPDYPHNGLSEALYRTGIPHVIGMRESVFDVAGIQFAKALLHAIGGQQPVDVALQAARAAITRPLQGSVYKDHNNPARIQASYGQWCLPQLLSHDLGHGLTNWNFTPQERAKRDLKAMLGQVSVPERFIGRRRELRQWQNKLRNGELDSLLITGAGGMGKTALAGKLVASLSKDGYQVFTFSLRPEHDWQATLLDMELALAEDDTQYKKYQLIQGKGLDEAKQAEWFLKLLLARCNGKLALFFDNLESVQQAQSPHALTDPTLQHWISAASQLTRHGLKLILTSRWRLPDWEDAAHYPLGKPVYGDYLAFARQQKLPLEFLQDPARLQRAYQVLGGNFRALEFFSNASKGMNLQQEQDFLARLEQAEVEIQTNMALAEVVAQRSALERELLHRLLAYQTATPLDGVKKVALVPPFAKGGLGGISDGRKIPLNPPFARGEEAEATLQKLLAVSLVEQYFNDRTGENTYQLSPLVRSWLLDNGAPEPSQPLLQAAAEFLLWQLQERLDTSWEHRLATHTALRTAGLMEEAHQVVWDWIAGPLQKAGMFKVLIDEWFQPMLDSANPNTRGNALNAIGQQHLARGDYDTALNYLKQSLAITQEIGNKSGEGAALNNISQIHDARGDYDTALNYLKQSLAIQQEIGDKSGEGTTLNNISQIHAARGDYDTALNYLKQALAIAQEIGDKLGEGWVLGNIAKTAHARGDYDTALNHIKQALAIQQEIGDKSGEGVTLSNISQIFKARGDYDTALNYLKQSLAIQQEIGDKSGEGAALNNISQIFQARGDYDTTLNYLKQALAIAQEIGNKSGEGTTLNNISQIYDARGDYDTALNYLKQSLAIQQEIGDKSGEGTTLNNISQIHAARGDYDTALNYLKQSLAIRQEIGDKSGEGTTLNNMAATAHARGDYDTALNYFKQSLAIQQEIGDKSGEGTTLNNISQIYDARGDYDTALNYLKQSLAIRQEIGDKSGEGTILNNMATTAHARGDYDTALNYLKQSLAIQQEIGDVAGLCATLFNMGHIHLQNEKAIEAIQAWLTVYGLAKQMHLAQALDALEKLAGNLGLPGGLDGWEMLAQQMAEQQTG